MSIAFTMSRRDRAALGVGVTAIALLIGLARGAPVYRKWTEDRENEVLLAARTLSTARIGPSSRSLLLDSLTARRTRLARLDSTLLFGTTPSAIAAGLAESIQALADSNSVKIGGMQFRVDTVPLAGLVEAEVRLAGVTDVIGLAGFLRAVEGDTTPYVVRELAVAQSDPAAGPGSMENLRIDIAIATLGAVRSGSTNR